MYNKNFEEAFREFFTNTKNFNYIPLRTYSLTRLRTRILNNHEFKRSTKFWWLEKANFYISTPSIWLNPKTEEPQTITEGLKYIFNGYSIKEISEKTGRNVKIISHLRREFRKKVPPSIPEHNLLLKFGFILIDECRVSKT